MARMAHYTWCLLLDRVCIQQRAPIDEASAPATVPFWAMIDGKQPAQTAAPRRPRRSARIKQLLERSNARETLLATPIRKEHLAALIIYRSDIEQHQKIDRLEMPIQRRPTANSRTVPHIDL